MRARRALALVASTLMGTGLMAAPVVAAAEPGIDWQPCGADAPGIYCATIEVPLDYRKPHGKKIHIGLAKRPATDPSRRVGSVLIHEGGPGISGVEIVMRRNAVSPEAAARFDQIGLDPRGVGTSTQLLCDLDLSRQVAAAIHPTNQAEFDRFATLNRNLHDSCRANSDGLAEHADTLHTARDMEEIRKALGEPKLTFVGYSYGTLAAQQYAELFPHNVRALVMDANMDHSLRSAWDFARMQTAPVEEAFHEFARWCDATVSCALHGLGTTAVYTELKARARAGTLTDPNGNKVDFYTLADETFYVAVPQVWSFIAQELRALYDGAVPAPPVTASALAEIGTDPFPAIWCGDWRFPVRDYDQYARIRAGLVTLYPIMEWTPYVDHIMTCVNSGTKTTNPQRPLKVHGAPPLVMLGNLRDPATPYPWSVTAAHQSGARLITYEGWNHTAYNLDIGCVNTAVDDYLINLNPPPRGLRCPSVDEPALAAATNRELVPDGRF